VFFLLWQLLGSARVPFEAKLLLEVQLVQLVFHEEQVCICGQIEVQLSQQHGRLWKIPQPQLAALQQCL